MAVRRWRIMLALAIMIAAASIVLSLALVDVLSQLAVVKGSYQLRARHAVVFTPFYPPGKSSSVADDTVRYLMNAINRQEAYTTIVYNMGIDDPDFASGHSTLVVFGDIVPRLFPDLQLCEPVPCAARGAKLAREKINSISVAGESVPVVKALPAMATFFDVGVAGLPLDRRIVIRAPTKVLPRLKATEREEALARAVFLNPAKETVDRYISGCAKGGCSLFPTKWP